MLGIESALPLESWSPYYRITLGPQASGAISISVNGIPHQTIESVAQRRNSVPLYFLPYSRVRTPPADVLIVGAGTGNDVAIALAQGVQHVDAVEIDPPSTRSASGSIPTTLTRTLESAPTSMTGAPFCSRPTTATT